MSPVWDWEVVPPLLGCAAPPLVLGESLDWPLVGVDWVEEGGELEELPRLLMSGLGKKWKERGGLTAGAGALGWA